jgi:hypothetical protein
MAVLTCHTEGCSNAEKPIEYEMTERNPDGTVTQIQYAVCGVCSQPITDIKR